MQQSGGGGRQDPEGTQADEGAVEADDEAVVGPDALHQFHGDLPQGDQLRQAVGGHGDVGDLAGNGGAVADGDAHVGGGEGGGVVDAVAQHDDGAACGVLGGHVAGLVLRQDLGAVVVHADLGGDGGGGAIAVAGEHHGLADAQGTQSADDALGLRAQGVRDADDGREHAANGQVQVGVLVGQGVELGLLPFGDDALLVLKDEVGAADDDLLLAHPAGDAVGNDVIDFGVHLLVGEVLVLGGLDHGVGHGVGEVLLQAGGQAEHVVLLLAVEGHDLDHGGAGAGEGAGLVEDDGVGLGQGLQELAALDGRVAAAGLAHGRQHGQRHGQLQGAGEIDHQHRQGTGHVPGQQIGHGAAGQGVGHELVGQVRGLVLGGGLEFLGLLDHLDDLIVAAGALLLGDLDEALSLFDDRTGVDGLAGAFGHGHGLAGERGLVDHDLAGLDDPVHGDHAAHADEDGVAGPDLGQGDEHVTVCRVQPDAVHVQGHAPGQVVHGFLVGPLLQQLAQAQQEHDGTGGREVSAGHGDADGQGVQQFHVQFTLPQTLDALHQVRNGAIQRVSRGQRRREKGRTQGLGHDLHHQLFLILPVQRPPGVGGGQLGDLGGRIGEAAEEGQKFLPVALIPDNGAAGALMHGDLLGGGPGAEIGFQ